MIPVAHAIPGGLCKNAVARVTHNGAFATTSAIKAGVVEFLSSGIFPATEVICHMIIGAADTHHSVATKAEYGMKRIGTVDYGMFGKDCIRAICCWYNVLFGLFLFML